MELQSPLRVVTAGVDGDVLGVLARADAEFTVPQLADLVERSTEGIRRALDRLCEQGIVVRHRVGRSTAYRLNREHLAAPAVIALAELPATLRGRISEVIASWEHPPFFAALFGSAARQQMRSDSDIDIVLIADETASEEWGEQVRGLTRAVAAWTGNDARALEYSTEEVRGRLGEEAVLREILDDGVPLAGDRSAFRRLVAS